MNNAIKVGMAFAGAAAIAVGGTAFTAANTVPTTAQMGTGATAVTGVTVTEAAFTYTADKATLNKVVYTIEDITDDNAYTATIAWSNPATAGGALQASTACLVELSVGGTEGMYDTVTCNTAGDLNYSVAAFTSLHLTVSTDTAV